MKTTSPKALHTATLTGLLSLALLSQATAADFTGSLKGVTITDAQATNKAPTAAFTYTVSGATVTFDAGGSSDSDGTITEYKWDFGDGSSGSDAQVQHTYSTLADVSVTLTVIDSNQGVALTQQQISHNETIGNSNLENKLLANRANTLYLFPISGTTTGDGVLSTYTINTNAYIAGRTINLAIYSFDGNNSLTLVKESATGAKPYTAPSNYSEVSIAPSLTTPIKKNTQYYIGYRTQGYAAIAGNDTGGSGYSTQLAYYSAWPTIIDKLSLTQNTINPGKWQITVTK